MTEQSTQSRQYPVKHFGFLNKQVTMRDSYWFLLGYGVWIGFYFGAIILHAMDK